MKKLLLIGAAALLPMSAANAAVTVSATVSNGPYSGPTPTIDFSSPAPVTGGVIATGSIAGQYKALTGLSDSYLAVGPKTTAVLDLSSFGSVTGLSFLWGSIDTYNTLEVLTTANAVLATITGSDILSALGGLGKKGQTDALVFLNFGGSPVTGLKFLSTAPAFEVDNIALSGAVPEPATWALMFAGFAGMGMMMRRRKTKLNVTYA